MKWISKNRYLVLMVFLAVVLRFAFIQSVPVSSTDDQIHYMVNSESFLTTGKDVSGTVSPLDILLFKYPPHESMQAELPYFLEMLSFSIFGMSFLSSLIPNLLLSIGTVIVAYFLGRELLGEKSGLMIGLITAINPWSIFIGRTAYEPAAATFFFLLGLLVLLKYKKWQILISIPIFYAAFYSYIGTKLIFIPFILICLLYTYFFVNKRQFIAQYSIVFLSAILLVGFFFFQITSDPTSSRLNEIFLPNNEFIPQHVDILRKESIPSALTPLANKLTVYKDLVLVNTANTLSPLYLFMTGDYFYSQQRQGLFYMIDALFLLLGIIGVYLKHKKVLVLFSSFFLIGLLPQILHGGKEFGNFTPHIILVISTFIFLIGYGIVFFIEELKGRWKMIGGAVIVALYAFSLINFLYIYLTVAPIQAGIFNFPERVAARYIKESSKMSKVTVLASDPAVAYRNYIFYSSSYTKGTATEINNALSKRERDNYILPNVRFISCTGVTVDPNDTVVQEGRCYLKGSGKSRIPDLANTVSSYTIYNDRLCRGIRKNLFQILSMNSLNVDGLSPQNFCKKLITE